MGFIENVGWNQDLFFIAGQDIILFLYLVIQFFIFREILKILYSSLFAARRNAAPHYAHMIENNNKITQK